MEKYIINLLEKNNRVIVPDLGAFIMRQNEPEDLVFNDLLAFDDGMLTDKLMLEERILKAEAQSRIKQFVDKTRRILETGEVYHIENLGSLRMDASSRIEFLGKDADLDPDQKEAGPDKKNIEDIKPESEAKELQEDANQSDYETEYLKLMTDGKKAKKKKPRIVLSEQKPETEPGSEPEPLAVAEAEEKEPEANITVRDTGEANTESSESEVPEGGADFVLADMDAEVEVDATSDDTPLEADAEVSRFQIDEDGEEPEKESVHDPFTSAIAEPEPEEDEPEKAEPEQALDQEPVIKDKSVSEMTAVDQARAAEESRAIAEERAAMLASRQKKLQEEKQVNTYKETDYKKKKTWPWILGLAALFVILLAIAWFMFPEKVNRFLSREDSNITLSDQHGKPGPETALSAEESGITQPPVEKETASDPEDVIPDQRKAVRIQEEVVPHQAKAETKAMQQTRPAAKQYYIVAGSFSNPANAESFVITLKNQGFNASIIGQRNNLHTVCFSSHSSRQTAEGELARIRKNYDAQAWLLYY